MKYFKVKEKVISTTKPKKSFLSKTLQLFTFFINPRNIYFTLKYRSNSDFGFFKCAFTLKTYSGLDYNQVFHIHFNHTLILIDICEIGYLDPKIIITFHGHDAFLKSKDCFQKSYGKFYKKHVKAVTVNLKYLKKAVLELGVKEELIHKIPIGFNRRLFNGASKTLNNNSKILLLTVGRLVQLKGHLYGLRAVKRLKEKGYDLQYIIVGEGDQRQNLENEVKNLELETCVTFTGALPQTHIKEIMRKANFFLMTSTFDDDTGRRETFGLVSIEAQAMGLPVIGFNSGGFPEMIPDGKSGFVIEDRSDIIMSLKLDTSY